MSCVLIRVFFNHMKRILTQVIQAFYQNNAKKHWLQFVPSGIRVANAFLFEKYHPITTTPQVISSLNFSSNIFNNMKKTNLIRVALLTVVMAFMGAFSLSAQTTSCTMPSSQALNVIEAELGVLKASKQVGIIPGNNLSGADQRKVGQNQSTNAMIVHNIKVSLLSDIAAEIKGNGVTTTVAVNTVDARFRALDGFDTRANIYNTAYQAVKTLLGCQ